MPVAERALDKFRAVPDAQNDVPNAACADLAEEVLHEWPARDLRAAAWGDRSPLSAGASRGRRRGGRQPLALHGIPRPNQMLAFALSHDRAKTICPNLFARERKPSAAHVGDQG